MADHIPTPTLEQFALLETALRVTSSRFTAREEGALRAVLAYARLGAPSQHLAAREYIQHADELIAELRSENERLRQLFPSMLALAEMNEHHADATLRDVLAKEVRALLAPTTKDGQK